MRLKTIAIAAILAATPFAASADEAADAAIKARQGFFNMLNINMGALADMAKGDVAFDADAAKLAAANLEAAGSYDVTIHFPAGTSRDDLDADRTAARAAIWDDPEAFAEKRAGLHEATSGAAEAIEGPESLGPLIARIGASCKACHDSYRHK